MSIIYEHVPRLEYWGISGCCGNVARVPKARLAVIPVGLFHILDMHVWN